jgi:hypothetical protein
MAHHLTPEEQSELDHLHALLKTYKRNLQHLESQVAAFGGLTNAPLHIINQRESTLADIARINQDIARITGQPL